MVTSLEVSNEVRLNGSEADGIRVDSPDDAVQQRVYRFLASLHFPVFRTFDVEVTQGAVTLTGQVRSYYEKQIAMTSCQAVAGVLSLIDRIAVIDTESNLGTCDSTVNF